MVAAPADVVRAGVADVNDVGDDPSVLDAEAGAGDADCDGAVVWADVTGVVAAAADVLALAETKEYVYVSDAADTVDGCGWNSSYSS